jgi:hypothetical protein
MCLLQLVLSATREMRTAWRTPEEIEANLEAREDPGRGIWSAIPVSGRAPFAST